MNREQFEQCKEIANYEDFMETSVGYNDLSLQHYEDFMPVIFDLVPNIEEKDPVKIYEKVIEELKERWTASENLPPHGPWHHGLLGGILVTALKNNGYDFSDEDIGEALQRGLMIPGGSCGFHGSCGAGTGLGIAVSMASRSTPFHDESRTKALAANSKAYARIAELGGPRCCTLSTYATLEIAQSIFEEMGYDIPVSEVDNRCEVYQENKQCHGVDCPYFPAK